MLAPVWVLNYCLFDVVCIWVLPSYLIIMVRFAKCRALYASVCGVKVVSNLFNSGCAFNMLIEIRLKKMPTQMCLCCNQLNYFLQHICYFSLIFKEKIMCKNIKVTENFTKYQRHIGFFKQFLLSTLSIIYFNL